ncbi:MAG: glutamate 5-kinase [Candidatus Methanomethylophilaceae archaeon]
MDRKEILGEVGRVVVKVGTSSITMGGDTVSSEFMDSVAEQVRKLRDGGKEVLIVTSGAIGIGLKAMNAKPKPKEIPVRQAAASVGQSILMQKWNDSFQKQGIVVAQILITLNDYSDRETILNLNNTIDSLLSYNVVPIFNENDAICVKEIGPMFGDNDTLSAVIASRADADLLVILSDVDGLYTKNPSLHEDAAFIPTVTELTPEILEMAGDTMSSTGTGGMRTKLKAAAICKDAGCRMIIALSTEKDVLLRAATGEDIGTVFVSDTHISKKKRWMKAAHSMGTVVIDDGAMKALTEHRSLLPVGVKEVTGQFSKGDVIDIVCKGEIVAKATPNYSSEEISRIRGMHSDRIRDVLGKCPYNDVALSENIALM